MPQNCSKESKSTPDNISLRGKNTATADYYYELPEEKTALYPLQNRDQSKLLVYNDKVIRDQNFNELPELLTEGDLLVFNRSKVIRARLHFLTLTGASVEVFCLNKIPDTEESVEKSKRSVQWLCMVGRASKWKSSEVLTLKNTDELTLEAMLLGRQDDFFHVKFEWNLPEIDFIRVLELFGKLPLPPYLNRSPADSDLYRYQTVYAEEPGSVAAPTAGLHFTPELLNRLKLKGIDTAYVTLHVGAGTFKPLKSETLAGHQMHEEEYFIPYETIQKLASCKGKIISVGTTSLRALESLYIGARLNASLVQLTTGQWDGLLVQQENYESNHLSAKDVFCSIMAQMETERLDLIHGYTSLLIAPPYQIKSSQALLTNFHQPGSTLLVLVGTIAGEKWRDIYQHALENNYRFLSYGDSSLLYV